MPSQIYENQLADAIFKAENSKSHPYGIIGNFTQQPREICVNTIRHRYSDWVIAGCNGDFISYLGKFYAPIGADNDPSGLNRNWVKNVSLFMGESK